MRPPDNAAALFQRANVLYADGQAAAAAREFERSLALDDRRAEVWYGLGHARLTLRDYDRSIEALTRAVALDERLLDAWQTLGCVQLTHKSESALAAAAFRRVLAIDPVHAEAQYNLAKALFKLGEVDEALGLWSSARRLAETTAGRQIVAESLKSIAVAIPGSPSASPERILAARREYGRLIEGPPPVQDRFQDRDLSPDRPLIVGYVSAFFKDENWMKPVWGLINQHDRGRFRVCLISNGSLPGNGNPTSADATAWKPHESDRVLEVTGLPNERLADVIRQERIDVLVDLNGYSYPHRLLLFALRPAPVIAAWFNQYATTGLVGFDYLVGDRHVVRPEEESHYTERIVCVPGSYLSFEVGYPVPEVSPPPCLTSGRVTFGSFCSQYKLTPDVVAAWAAILQACPSARLLLRNGELDSASNRDHLCRRFAVAGVSASRLELLGRAPHYEFLQTYARIDVALDTFPYNGGTTTTEAIWQGVPVIAFDGDRWAGRTSASILREGGLGDWVAQDLAGYIQLAIRWANDSKAPARLAELRLALRDGLRNSSVCQMPKFARAMESLYRQMWRNWSSRKTTGATEPD